MSKEVVAQKTNAIAAMSPAEINSAMQIVFPNLQKHEYELGVKIANEFGLNPLKREIYLISYGSKLSIIIGYEVFLKRAERIGNLDGWKCETLVEDDDLIARVTIHRKDRAFPFVWDVCLREYDQNNKMWKDKPRTMLKKVAIAQSFRLCFPEELGGLPYIADEMPPHMAPAQPQVGTVEESPAYKAIKKAREVGLSDDLISATLGTDDWELANLDGVKKLCDEVRKVMAIKANKEN